MSDSKPVQIPTQPGPVRIGAVIMKTLFALFMVYLLITSVSMVGTDFKWASGGSSAAKAIFAFAINPFVGLILGIFATALVQSSSTVTSVIVGLVASGSVGVSTAVPMIFGANIGTTVTNTIVSLGHITRPQEFRRAFEAATVHDVFNFLAVAIFLPLEVLARSIWGVGLLEGLTHPIAIALAGTGTSSTADSVSGFNPIKDATKVVIDFFYHHDKKTDIDTGILASLGNLWGGITMVAIAITTIFGSIWALGKFLKSNLTGRAEKVFHAAVGRGPISGIVSGTVVTVMVQSSSTTTSLVIPMAGAGIMKLEQVYPFTLGANIGTCITALVASMGASSHPEAGLQIALVHLCFNTFATILIYGVPLLRKIPLWGARRLADLAIYNRVLAIAYILIVYFALPILMIVGMKMAGVGSDTTESKVQTEMPFQQATSTETLGASPADPSAAAPTLTIPSSEPAPAATVEPQPAELSKP